MSKTLTELFFDEGRQAFLQGKPRPDIPQGENGLEKPEDAAYYGWMIERARKIDFLSKWLKIHMEQGSSSYEQQLTRSIEAMDLAYGLEGKYDVVAYDIPSEDT